MQFPFWFNNLQIAKIKTIHLLSIEFSICSIIDHQRFWLIVFLPVFFSFIKFDSHSKICLQCTYEGHLSFLFYGFILYKTFMYKIFWFVKHNLIAKVLGQQKEIKKAVFLSIYLGFFNDSSNWRNTSKDTNKFIFTISQ